MLQLNVKHTKPLEREFEAWIVSGIECYFERLGIPSSIFAVSPGIEKVWPADERMLANGKVFGLQFKQAKLSGSNVPDFAQLKWSFNNPPGQLAQVIATPEIYYCLPTFINRDYRKEALHHCLFWRPDPASVDMNAWYNNPKAYTPYAVLEAASRWGLFVEQVFSCKIGRRINSSGELASYVKELEQFRRYSEDAARSQEQASDEGLYLVAVSLES